MDILEKQAKRVGHGSVNAVDTAAAPGSSQTTDSCTPSVGSAGPSDPVSLKLSSLAALSAALLAACGGGGSGGGGGVGDPATGNAPAPVGNLSSAPGFNNNPKALTDEQAARFLLQSQLSASDQDISSVRSGSFAGYLLQQFSNPPSQTGWDWLEERGYGKSDTNRYFFTTYPAEYMLYKQLFTSPDSMRKRIALALSEFFVSSMQSAEFTWRSHAYAQYWDLLVGNAFGNYRQLLEEVTLSSAMGYFLNTQGNQKEDARTGRVPDENYAREVMQLFSIGVVQLNINGTEKTANGKKLESYTQDDVSNLARIFTGYQFDNSDGEKLPVYKDGGGTESYTIDGRQSVRKRMALDASKHSTLAATFLGTTVAANTSGAKALETALDALANHPNTGPFFARQMIQRLVTSNPSPEYVERVARAFNNNGAGVRGDLKAVWVAILLDDEARGAASLASPTFGKLREPMVRFIQWGRTFGLASGFNSWKVGATTGADNSLGQSPLFAPSVFNFFRPGFVPPNTALATAQASAPEFQLVNETTVGGYLNYMQNVIRYGIYVPEPSVAAATFKNYLPDVKATYAAELPLAADAAALVKRLKLLLCAGQMSAATESIIVGALNARPVLANSTTDQKLDRIGAAVLMVMGCSEYLIQK